MTMRGMTLGLCALVAAALLAGGAAADPTNANALVISFACDNGVTYDGTAIAQNNSSTGHVLAASDASLVNAVFQAVRITVDGVVVKQIPGFAGVPMVNCRITAIGGEPVDASIITNGFFTPRRG